jgi:hypothetical protein
LAESGAPENEKAITGGVMASEFAFAADIGYITRTPLGPQM